MTQGVLGVRAAGALYRILPLGVVAKPAAALGPWFSEFVLLLRWASWPVLGRVVEEMAFGGWRGTD